MVPGALKAPLSFVWLIVCWLGVATSVLVSCQAINGLDGEDDNVVGGYYKPGITSAQILEARGFLAKEFFFTTEDNFELSIIRARSPIINNGRGGLANKEPILFIHGTIVSSSIWVTNSRGARPRDFTGVQVNSSSLEQLIEQVGSDPGSFSLPILMMNFGYEVWLLNRRGTLESENRVGSNARTLLDAIKSIVPSLFGGGFGPNLGLGVFGPAKNSTNVVGNKSSLNSTGQEQVSHFDYNQLIELIDANLDVESLKRELSVSFDEPQRTRSFLDEFLQPFINLPSALFDFGKFIRRFIRTFDPKFWAFSLDEQVRFDVSKAVEFVLKSSGRKQLTLVGHSAGAATILLKLSEEPEFAQKVSKAILLAPALNLGHADSNIFTMFVTPLIQAYVGPIPFTFLTQQLQAIIQVICDFKSTQYTLCEGVADLIVGPGGGQHPITPSISAAILQPTSSRELIHLGQFAADKKPRKFNFNTPDENLKVYGSIEPPIYDLSRIRLQKMSFYAGVSDTLVSPDDVRVTLSQLAAPHRFNLIGGLGVFFNHGGYFDHKRLNKLVAIPVLKDIEHFLRRTPTRSTARNQNNVCNMECQASPAAVTPSVARKMCKELIEVSKKSPDIETAEDLASDCACGLSTHSIWYKGLTTHLMLQISRITEQVLDLLFENKKFIEPGLAAIRSTMGKRADYEVISSQPDLMRVMNFAHLCRAVIGEQQDPNSDY